MNETDSSITFFHYGSSVEKSSLAPIADVAEQRGYEVTYSTDTTESAEIGVYNTHVLSTESINADHAVGIINSVDDGYDPNYFWKERWNRFDVGMVIGKENAKNWQSISWNRYARPAEGVYTVGWPKSDWVYTEDFDEAVETTRGGAGLVDGTTAVYAPAEESEGKMFEFLNAADGQVGNMVIKHKGSEDYSEVNETDYESNLVILDNTTDIFVALEMADLLVSEQSGVLVEAIHVDTIPVSVTDWPINLGVGRQFPGTRIPPFVETTTREELGPTIEAVCEGTIDRDFERVRERNFSNLGRSAEATLDVIETVILNDESHPARVEPQKSAQSASLWEQAYIYAQVLTKDTLSPKTQRKLMDLGAGKLLMRLDDLFTSENRKQ